MKILKGKYKGTNVIAVNHAHLTLDVISEGTGKNLILSTTFAITNGLVKKTNEMKLGAKWTSENHFSFDFEKITYNCYVTNAGQHNDYMTTVFVSAESNATISTISKELANATHVVFN